MHIQMSLKYKYIPILCSIEIATAAAAMQIGSLPAVNENREQCRKCKKVQWCLEIDIAHNTSKSVCIAEEIKDFKQKCLCLMFVVH